MKFSALFSGFALASTAFSAVIPRTAILDTIATETALAVALDQLNTAIKDFGPINTCTEITPEDIAKLDTGETSFLFPTYSVSS